MGVYKRVFQLGNNSAICLSKLSKFELATAKLYGTTAAAASSNSSGNQLSYRRISHLNGSRAFLVDTLALVTSSHLCILNVVLILCVFIARDWNSSSS